MWYSTVCISLTSSLFIENLSSSERVRAHARANHAKNDAQKGSAMQLNGITLRPRYLGQSGSITYCGLGSGIQCEAKAFFISLSV